LSHRLTIKEALTQAADLLTDSDSSLLDSEVLLAHVLKKTRSYFRAWPEKVLTPNELKAFQHLIEQRKTGQPIAYLTGEREFWSRSFNVSPDVLIPRPDTELLIDIVQENFSPDQAFSILDLGTGSGIIAITLALEFKNATVTAVDISEKALSMAKKNARQHKADHIQFILSSWFKNIPKNRFDLIISNPPYISPNDQHLREGDVRFEPNSALIAQDNGLDDFKKIITKASVFLNPKGTILLEHGFQQGAIVKNLLESSGFVQIRHYQDIQGHVRATLGKKP
tara:strand:+ start:930 stop:1775 length:846 start_codon:yes stop_codon:yes gene_type:complete